MENKCNRCRFTQHNKCVNKASEFNTYDIDIIGIVTENEGCESFFSENDEENTANNDPDTNELSC